jgi:cytochrome c oxidase subunit II
MTWSRWLVSVTAVAGCGGSQSALAPAGRESARLAELFWWMTGASVVIWGVVVALTIYASFAKRPPRSARTARLLIVAGGFLAPTVVLTGVLAYGLALLPSFLAPAPDGSLEIHVAGEQWWWRVRYHRHAAPAVELANEIRLPVGEPVELVLESDNVIHSFWIPSLGGKMDMIPGRRTRLKLQPTQTGTFRGVCAEYCGASHAFMAFSVVVEARPAFEGWLARQAEAAGPADDPGAVRGRDLFRGNGCGACHAIRGTAARGVVGPDLTHVGGRASLAAGRLTNDIEGFRRWLTEADTLKPKTHMPVFRMLAPDELGALAAYLESLQ